MQTRTVMGTSAMACQWDAHNSDRSSQAIEIIFSHPYTLEWMRPLSHRYGYLRRPAFGRSLRLWRRSTASRTMMARTRLRSTARCHLQAARSTIWCALEVAVQPALGRSAPTPEVHRDLLERAIRRRMAATRRQQYRTEPSTYRTPRIAAEGAEAHRSRVRDEQGHHDLEREPHAREADEIAAPLAQPEEEASHAAGPRARGRPRSSFLFATANVMNGSGIA